MQMGEGLTERKAHLMPVESSPKQHRQQLCCGLWLGAGGEDLGATRPMVRGKGNADSFETCSHGGGRAMSRAEARRRFTLEDHARATAHVECGKDEGVIDETPGAYKDIDAVMAAHADLVEIVRILRQIVCV